MIFLIVFALLVFGEEASGMTLCREAPGGTGKSHWSWREIDGRRCWFEGKSRPSKSGLTWKSDATNERKVMPDSDVIETPHPSEDEATSVDRYQTLRTRVLPEWRTSVPVDDKSIDLMRGDELQGPAGIGGMLIIPPYRAQ